MLREKVMETKRRSSRPVVLGLLSVVAATVACDDDPEQIVHCVDQNGVVVDSTWCDPQPAAGSTIVHHHGGGIIYHHVYHTTFHPVGVVVTGGSSTPLPGRSVVTHAHFTTRSSGFGSTGMRFSMGGG